MGQQQWKATRRGQRGGRQARQSHERNIFAGVQAHVGERLMAGLMSEAPEFSKNHAQSVEMPARLAALVPISLAEALSAANMGGDGERARTAGVQTYGGCPPVWIAGVLRLDELKQLHKVDLIGAKKGVLDSWSLIVCPQERNHPTKNWSLGRQCPPGLRVAKLEGRKMWPFGLVEFGTKVRKAADALSIIDISKQSRGKDAIMKKRKMAKCQNSEEVRETCAICSGVSIVQRHADRAFRELCRSARGGDLWARRASRCAAAMKSEAMAEISEGGGQVARVCEDRGFLKPKRGSLVESLLIKPCFLLCVTCFMDTVF